MVQVDRNGEAANVTLVFKEETSVGADGQTLCDYIQWVKQQVMDEHQAATIPFAKNGLEWKLSTPTQPRRPSNQIQQLWLTLDRIPNHEPDASVPPWLQRCLPLRYVFHLRFSQSKNQYNEDRRVAARSGYQQITNAGPSSSGWSA